MSLSWLINLKAQRRRADDVDIAVVAEDEGEMKSTRGRQGQERRGKTVVLVTKDAPVDATQHEVCEVS